MKIIPVRNIYSLPSFESRTKKEETKKQYAAIKEAIEVIAKDSSYPVRIKSISEISGIPTSIIISRMHTHGSNAYEISKLWQETVANRKNPNNICKSIVKNDLELAKKDKEEKNYKAIKEAIEQISQDSNLKPTKATIAGLTGLSDGQLNYYFNNKSPKGEELSKLWNCTLKQRKAKKNSISLSMSAKAPSKEELEKIETAIDIIIKNHEYPPTTSSISKLSGISECLVCVYVNHPSTQKLLEKLEGKRVIRNTKMNLDAQKTNPIKAKNLKKAITLIQQALSTGTRLSYKEFEITCGLNKDEVNMLVKQYANFKRKQSKQQRTTKEQQAKWYYDNIVNKETSVSFYSGSEYNNTAITQATKIEEAMTELKNQGIKITYAEISRYTGIEYTAVKFRINDPNFPNLKEIFENSQ